MALSMCHIPMVDTPALSLSGRFVFYTVSHLPCSDACDLLLQSELHPYDQCSFIFISRYFSEINRAGVLANTEPQQPLQRGPRTSATKRIRSTELYRLIACRARYNDILFPFLPLHSATLKQVRYRAARRCLGRRMLRLLAFCCTYTRFEYFECSCRAITQLYHLKPFWMT